MTLPYLCSGHKEPENKQQFIQNYLELAEDKLANISDVAIKKIAKKRFGNAGDPGIHQDGALSRVDLLLEKNKEPNFPLRDDLYTLIYEYSHGRTTSQACEAALGNLSEFLSQQAGLEVLAGNEMNVHGRGLLMVCDAASLEKSINPIAPNPIRGHKTFNKVLAQGPAEAISTQELEMLI